MFRTDNDREPLPKQAILIVNAKSRKGAEAFDQACAKLKAAGVELIDAHAVEKPRKMGRGGRAAIARRRWSSSAAATARYQQSIDDFVGTDTVFALLPLGTANSFARTMGIRSTSTARSR